MRTMRVSNETFLGRHFSINQQRRSQPISAAMSRRRLLSTTNSDDSPASPDISISGRPIYGASSRRRLLSESSADGSPSTPDAVPLSRPVQIKTSRRRLLWETSTDGSPFPSTHLFNRQLSSSSQKSLPVMDVLQELVSSGLTHFSIYVCC